MLPLNNFEKIITDRQGECNGVRYILRIPEISCFRFYSAGVQLFWRKFVCDGLQFLLMDVFPFPAKRLPFHPDYNYALWQTRLDYAKSPALFHSSLSVASNNSIGVQISGYLYPSIMQTERTIGLVAGLSI